ncbi:hypothetical protein AB5I41_09595 [Sphingomonas sp. MMS24-JH45]
MAKAFKGETGITAELKKAKAVYDKLDWQQLDAEKFSNAKIKHGERVTPAKADEVLKAYLDEVHPTFAPLEKTFAKLSTFLSGQAKTMAGSTTTKSAGKTAQTMADAANKFSYAVAWGTISSKQQAYLAGAKTTAIEVEKSWAAARGKIQPEIARAAPAVKDFAQKIRPYMDRLAAGGSDAPKPGTLKMDYEKLCGKYLRGIGAKIKQASDPALEAQFKGPLETAKKQWSQSGGPSDDRDVPDHIRNAIALLTDFSKAAKAAKL